jgi:hypothetical protein
MRLNRTCLDIMPNLDSKRPAEQSLIQHKHQQTGITKKIIVRMSCLWDGTATQVVEKPLLNEHKEQNYTGYQMNEAQDTQTTGTPKSKPVELSPKEQELIDWLEKEEGRKLTQQEVNLTLDQARQFGRL